MTTPRRRSLADRNESAIASSDTTEEATPTTAPTRPAQHRPRKAVDAAETRRISVSMTALLYNNCKAAFLADWINGGVCDQFRLWVSAALARHAARSPMERAETHSEATGTPRSFIVSVDTYAAMVDAMVDDQQADRWLTLSGWAVEALTAAVDAARARNVAELPTPPERLPHRLRR